MTEKHTKDTSNVNVCAKFQTFVVNTFDNILTSLTQPFLNLTFGIT